jgi:hypothetical protein
MSLLLIVGVRRSLACLIGFDERTHRREAFHVGTHLRASSLEPESLLLFVSPLQRQQLQAVRSEPIFVRRCFLVVDRI